VDRLTEQLTATDGGSSPQSMNALRRLVWRMLDAVDVPLRGTTP